MSLIIPSLLLSGAILVGSPYTTETAHQQEASRILETSIYKYADWNSYGAHDYGIFKRLPEIRKNALVIINNKRYRVQSKEIIGANDVTKMLNGNTYLFTCRNRDRLIILLK